MQDILMEINNLSYRYEDGTLALDQVSLQIRRHERLAIMGSNGSGKSTLFLNLNGVYRPTGGQILYEGRPVDYSRKGLLELRRQVGIVFQDPDNQLFCASVAGEISFGLYNLGLDEEEIRRRVDAVCQKLSIDPFRDKPTHFLSGGQKKRVSIADILVMRPSLLADQSGAAGNSDHLPRPAAKEAVAGRNLSQNGRIPLLDAALLTNIPFRASFFFLALVIFGHYSYNNRYKEAHPKTNQAGGMDR